MVSWKLKMWTLKMLMTYFNELINRSLIQASRVNIEGVVKSCRVHDIVRDVMVSISRDENFVYIAGDDVTSVIEGTFRHVACHGSKWQNVDMDLSHIRSLTVFSERPLLQSLPVSSPDLRMLRALDLENAQFKVTQKDISNIGLLRHLKYVNFSDPQGYSHIYKLPRSIGKLQGLRTLNVRHSLITGLPTEISELKSLRNIRCARTSIRHGKLFDQAKECLRRTFRFALIDPSGHADAFAELYMAWSSFWSMSVGVKMPRGIGNLKELQILGVVDISRTSSKTIKELGGLVQLKKLSVATEGATKKKCKVLCDVIQNLSTLYSLQVSDNTLKWLHAVSSPPPLLRTLGLYGYLGEIPVWFGNLMHLVKLHIGASQLKEEGKPMEILGALPNLMLLHLDWSSYSGEMLVFKMGAFPTLKKLVISQISQISSLKEVKFEDGTSPHMETIDISYSKLKSGIICINHLPRLKEISLGYNCKVGNFAVLQGEVDAHPNSPVLRLSHTWSYHDMGDAVQGSNEAQVEETMEEPSAAGESSSQVMLMPPTSNSQDGPLYTYNSC